GLTAVISGNSIKFTGTPTVAGSYPSANITVTDSLGGNNTLTFAMTINAAPTLGSLSQTAWTANVGGFPGTITISGGTGPYTIVNSQNVPFNLVVSGNTILFT